ncbi:MAG TPA: V-type ATP synthase subunit A [bacterium]|nr:V-type ATP synthase subunit A [bacterium]
MKPIGRVNRVLGPVVHASGVTGARMMELVEVGADRLIGEIVRLDGDEIVIQVYEDTTGLAPGAPVYGSGHPLSVELGPGLIGSVYDGVQRPLDRLKAGGYLIRRGVRVPSLDREKAWIFEPCVKPGDLLRGGAVLGTVQETERISHRVLVPPSLGGAVKHAAEPGLYRVEETIAVLETESGEIALTMMQRWPVRHPRPIAGRVVADRPLLTGQRVIDTLFPVAKGGTVVVPGGFGTGKTSVEHQLAKWSDADIVVYIGCGERGNEMTHVLREFPRLSDPWTGRPLMERTVLIANTSNMPVAAREASIYTGITLAEYYRDQGYHVAVMADSTSRWAEALRELSGRMEEMPAEEGFPAYLPTRLAEFYERGGQVKTLSGKEGSITIVGAVSPPGGDFSEPVTQHTKRFVRCFWALDRDLANARHYPAISWMDSYSEYVPDVTPWWTEKGDAEWAGLRREIMELLQKEARLQQVVKLVGADVLPDSQRLILEVCDLFKNTFLQQSAFDAVDAYSTVEKQVKMLKLIVTFYRLGRNALDQGATLIKIKRMRILKEIRRMKFNVSNEEVFKLDDLQSRLEREMGRLGEIYGGFQSS